MKTFLLVICFAGIIARIAHGAEPAEIRLWPSRAPGELSVLPPEQDTTGPGEALIAGQRVIRLGNVSDPTLSVYRPAQDKANGAAILVCPGGGYHILAMDLEGTEVCSWLNSIGVTAVLVKYRVPARSGMAPYVAPLQDAQRALGLIRSRAIDLGIDPRRIGILGFSAGGHLAATLSNNFEKRGYPHIDSADDVSCRPDFTVLIYPGGLVDKDKHDAVADEVIPAAGRTPPMFLVMAEDDPVRVEHAALYYVALKQAGVPVEMHLYPTGGHGYGLRRTSALVTTWPERLADWLRAGDWLTTAK
jgi:acetyl esterase/lipase